MTEDRLRAYARLILSRGVNVQEGQIVVVNALLEHVDFARILVREAYELGASDVQVIFADEELGLLRSQKAAMESLREYPSWMAEARRCYVERGACFVTFTSGGPIEGVSPERSAALAEAAARGLAAYRRASMSGMVRTHASGVATVRWARRVFPRLRDVEAVEALWGAILHCAYADADDPISAWDGHVGVLRSRIDALDSLGLAELRFEGGGTDLRVKLADDALWYGGAVVARDGVVYSPSIPTEEVFTAPNAAGVEGEVRNVLPLCHAGGIIDGFALRFRGGRVVDWTAGAGGALLAGILDADAGSRSLGEVSLVPASSRVGRTGLLFYETQYDENAACHLALGAGYPPCIGGEDRSDAALAAKGLNQSRLHVDFMFGGPGLSVRGRQRDGTWVPLMEAGEFLF